MLKKIAFAGLGIALLTSPLLTSADVISDLQAQIQSLLVQIGALQQQINAAVGTTTPPVLPFFPPPVPPQSCVALNSSLSLDDTDADTGGDVTRLQQFLASQGPSIYPEARITGYFGPATMRAVQRWQAAHGLVSSGDPDSTGYGYVGPRTRAAMGCITLPPPIPPLPFPSATVDQHGVEASGFFVLSGSAWNTTGVVVALVLSTYQGATDFDSIDSGVGVSNGVLVGPATVSNNRWAAAFSGVPTGAYTLLVYDFSTHVALVTSGSVFVGVQTSTGTLILGWSNKSFKPIYNLGSDLAQKICDASATLYSNGTCTWNGNSLTPRGVRDGDSHITIHYPSPNASVIQSNHSSFSFTDPSAMDSSDYRVFYVRYVIDSVVGDIYELPFSKFGRNGAEVNGDVDISQLPNGNYYPGIVNVSSGVAGSVGAYVFLTGSVAPFSGYDFGGMYGWGHNPSKANESVKFLNPATNDQSCLSDYTAAQVLGTGGLDYPVYFCYRPHTTGRDQLYDFGGMYGWGHNGSSTITYSNPLTRSNSCPSGYSAWQVLGTGGLDYPIYFCYKPHAATQDPIIKFGGMYGYGNKHDGTTDPAIYKNPATGAMSCPSGYTAAPVLGTGGLDYPVYFCYVPAPIIVSSTSQSGTSANLANALTALESALKALLGFLAR